MTPVALTVAGSDPSGGAGLQADLKTFHQHRVYGAGVVSLLTVQNTKHVSYLRAVDTDVVVGQFEAVLEDIPPHAVKIGAVGSAETTRALGQVARDLSIPVVLDPVMVSKHGQSLLDGSAREVLKWDLLPYATVVTPNLQEASWLSGMEITDRTSMDKAATEIAAHGPRHVVVKGGVFDGNSVDVLWTEGEVIHFESERVETADTHGSGCVFSAAITARLARGESLPEAVGGAKAFVSAAIVAAPRLGKGRGPTNMHVVVDESSG